MSIAIQIAMTGAIAYEMPELRPVLQEHLNDYDGEVLPHLLLAEFVRAITAAPLVPLAPQFWQWLEVAYASGDDQVQELIVTGALEAIPAKDEPGHVPPSELPPQLAEELSNLV